MHPLPDLSRNELDVAVSKSQGAEMSLQLHEIAEAGHRILDPFTDAQLMELGAVARIGADTRVLDLACGKAEMLCRWAQTLGCQGVGVDLSEVFSAAARARASELGVNQQILIEQGDASSYVPESGSFDVACCIGATWIGGGVPGTVDLLRPAVPSTGLILIGEPFWREPPPPEARAAVGDDPELYADLSGLLRQFDAAGVELVEMVLADEHSWDRYVAAHWWTLRQWLDANPSESLHTLARAFLDESRSSYLRHQRRSLGWGVFVLTPTR